MRAQPTGALAAGLVVLVCLAALPCSHGCAPSAPGSLQVLVPCLAPRP